MILLGHRHGNKNHKQHEKQGDEVGIAHQPRIDMIGLPLTVARAP
jgi:hypothetical protein